jgi:nitrate reductase NapE component
MACETVNYAKPCRQRNSVNDLLLFTVVPLVAGGFIWGFGFGIVLAFLSLCIRQIAYSKDRTGLHTSFEKAKSQLIAQGYQLDFVATPCFAIDSQKRKCAMVIPAQGRYDLYDLSDILRWEHKWIDKSTPLHSALTNRVKDVKITKINNRLVIETNNPHSPFYDFPIGSYDNGELWMARFGALMSGK